MPEYDMPRPRFRADDPDQEKQVKKIISWLLKQDEKIRYILNNLDEENFSEGLNAQISEALSIATSVNGTAQKEEIDALTGRVRRAETRIDQNEDAIAAKASQTEVDGLETRMDSAEAKITPGAIVATVRSSTEYQDDQHEFETEYSEIELTKDKARISTPEFVVNIIRSGAEETSLQIDEDGAQMDYLSVEKMIKAPNMAEKYMGKTSLTVGTGGDFATLQEAFDTLNNRIVTEDVTIQLVSDIAENAELRGVSGGGSVRLTGYQEGGAQRVLSGSVEYAGCTCRLYLNDMTILGAGIGFGLAFSACNYASADSVTIDGQGLYRCLQADSGTRLILTYAKLYNATVLIDIERSTLHAGDCEGYGGTYYMRASNSVWTWDGTRPEGSLWETGANIYNDNSSGTSRGTAPTPAQKVIETQNVTATLTGNWYGSDWSSEQALRQGKYYNGGSANTYTGAMWFPLGTLSGTATRAAVTLTRRIKTGRSGTVDVRLYKMSNQGKSGAPELTGGVLLGSIASGERKSFDIPAGYVTMGGLTGLAIRADDTQAMSGRSYSDNYAAFEGTDGDAPVLTVQYETT